jgi:hypothetical protein
MFATRCDRSSRHHHDIEIGFAHNVLKVSAAVARSRCNPGVENIKKCLSGGEASKGGEGLGLLELATSPLPSPEGEGLNP